MWKHPVEGIAEDVEKLQDITLILKKGEIVMKFKRWKKLLVMLLITTMFLQNVAVYADGGGPSVTMETSETDAAADESDPADISDVPDTSDTTDAPDVADVEGPVDESDAADAPDTTDASDTEDVADPADESDAADVPDTTDVPDTEDVAGAPDTMDVPDTADPVDVPDITDPADAPNAADVPDTTEVPDTTDVPDIADTPDETEEVEESIPAEVQAFVDAMANLPNASEVTIDNVVKISNVLNDEVISDGYALAGKSGEEEGWMTDEIRSACAKYEELFLAVSAVTDTESEIYYPDYSEPDILPEKTVAQVNNMFPGLSGKGTNGKLDTNGGTITKYVGESGFYRRCPLDRLYGARCGHLMLTLAPEGYCEFTVTYTNPQIISAVDYGVGYWYGDGLSGVPCLQANFDAQKPGNTTVAQTYYVNFLQDYGQYRCGTCGLATTFPKDYTWHKYKDTFSVTVRARYQLNYDTDGGSYVSPTIIDNTTTSAALNVTNVIPTKAGYEFKGWKDENGNMVSGSVTLNWSEGYGSKNNPVSKTLYAVWE